MIYRKLTATLLSCIVATLTLTAHAAQQEPTPAPEIERISPERLRDMLAKNEAIVVDVRDEESYLNGHIKGALHLSGDTIAARAKELPRDKTIVTYCT